MENELLPLNEKEREILRHIGMWGSAAYPVRKLGRGWEVGEFFGVKGPPKIYKTKREAVAQFELYMDLLRERHGYHEGKRAEREAAEREAAR